MRRGALHPLCEDHVTETAGGGPKEKYSLRHFRSSLPSAALAEATTMEHVGSRNQGKETRPAKGAKPWFHSLNARGTQSPAPFITWSLLQGSRPS